MNRPYRLPQNVGEFLGVKEVIAIVIINPHTNVLHGVVILAPSEKVNDTQPR